MFECDHILDLASKDSEYLATSIHHLERTIEATIKCKQFFSSSRPFIILNVGGSTTSSSLSPEEIEAGYSQVISILNQYHSSDYELIIQTMPPFPWHFGGQRLHNLFVNPSEIFDILTSNMTLLRHLTYISCNHLDVSFIHAVKKLPLAAHFHIVDANGTTDEGLQLGDGSIDFRDFMRLLLTEPTQASFIPEIWQGHKDHGSGFWKALNYLSDCLS